MKKKITHPNPILKRRRAKSPAPEVPAAPPALEPHEPLAIKIRPEFEVTHESHPRRKFQREGHFLPGRPDPHREWSGRDVHIVQLFCAGEQVLRVLSDSFEAAVKRMEESIGEHFHAMVLREKIVQNDATEYQRVKLQRDMLVMWMKENRHHSVLAEILETTPQQVQAEANFANTPKGRKFLAELRKHEAGE